MILCNAKEKYWFFEMIFPTINKQKETSNMIFEILKQIKNPIILEIWAKFSAILLL